MRKSYFSKGFNEIVVSFAECMYPGEIDEDYKKSQTKAIETLFICCGRLKNHSRAAFLIGIEGVFDPEQVAERMKCSALYANKPKPTKEDVSQYQNTARNSLIRCMKKELGIKNISVDKKKR